MEQGNESQNKMKRIAVGATIAGVLLFVFLVVILVIQFVQIGVKRSELRKYDEMIEELNQQTAQDAKELDAYQNGNALYYLALKRGWTSQG